MKGVSNRYKPPRIRNKIESLQKDKAAVGKFLSPKDLMKKKKRCSN